MRKGKRSAKAGKSRNVKGLRPYQVECIKKVAALRRTGIKRAMIVVASGLGKTIISAAEVKQFLAENNGGRVLFLCNREDLLEQAREVYQDFFGDSLSYGVYTGLHKTKSQPSVLFATYQTMQKNLQKFGAQEFAYVVVDEAHHAVAPTFRKILDYFKPQFLLGMTATPERLDGQNLAIVFGSQAFKMDVFEGIASGWLAEADYYIMMEDPKRFMREVKKQGIKSFSGLDKKFFSPKRDEEIVRSIMKRANEFAKNPRIMVFCKSVEHAERIAALFKSVGVVHSRRTGKQNRETLRAYRDGKIQVIVSVQMLNEGLDVPETDVVVFLRNTVSPTVFFQQLGRGLRICSGKKKVLVLDYVANCKRIAMILCSLANVQQQMVEHVMYNSFRVRFMSESDAGEEPKVMPVRIKEFKRRGLPQRIDTSKSNFVSETFDLAELVSESNKLEPVIAPEINIWVEQVAELICRQFPVWAPRRLILGLILLDTGTKLQDLARRCLFLQNVIEMRQLRSGSEEYASLGSIKIPEKWQPYEDVVMAFCIGFPAWVSPFTLLKELFGEWETVLSMCRRYDFYKNYYWQQDAEVEEKNLELAQK